MIQRLLPIFCLFILFGCRSLKDLEFKGVNGFKVNTINTQTIDADILLKIKNPNRFGFYIYESEFDVTYSGIYLGKAKLQKRVRIKANAEETYSFNLKKNFKDLNLLDVMKLINGSTGVGVVEVKGDLKAGKLLMKKKFPIDINEKVGL